MTGTVVEPTSPLPMDAAIFDLDGVITDTATTHAAAWQALFDDYFATRASRGLGSPVPFASEIDYPAHLAGVARYEGVRNLLRSRGIALPQGSPEDGPERETVFGLGNRKNRLFTSLLTGDTVHVFPSTVALAQELANLGVHIGVASASQNCRRVLDLVGLSQLFPVVVDGNLARELHLRSKPEPDLFLKCVKLVGADPARSLVAEDAVAGVQAGRAGGFGLVVGVDRAGIRDALAANGAHLVVGDLSELTVDDLRRYFTALPRGARAPVSPRS